MVVVTNVVISILLEPSNSKKEFVLNHSLLAPQLLKIELINVLRKYHFLQHVPKADALKYYENGISLFTNFIEDNQLLNVATELSFRLNHPIYDCLYLALAIELNQPFASLDKKLLKKAASLGINIVDFEHV